MSTMVYVGFPIHNHPTAHFMGSFIQMIASQEPGVTFGFDFKINVSNLPVERCFLVHEARKMKADVMLFIDDDITFEPQTAFSIIRSAVEEKAVVAATYKVKMPEGRHVGFALEQANRPPETKGTLKGMASVGMGMTAIHMSVVDRILRLHESGEYHIPFFKAKRFPGEQIAGLFEFKVGEDLAGDARFIQEDEMFCQHVIKTGGKIWIDTAFTVGHVGQFVYR
jgi:hypothetical protein